MHIAFSINKLDFLRSHRMPLVREALRRDWKVSVIAAHDADARDAETAAELQRLGCDLRRVRLTRSGTGLLDLRSSVKDLEAHYRAIRADLAHQITPKMVTLGTIAARRVGVPAVVNAISGLGILASGSGLRGKVMALATRALYGYALRHPNQYLIVQNERDQALLEQVLRPPLRFVHFYGSGVDLTRFVESPIPQGAPIVTFAARLLRAKGLLVFADAARILRTAGVNARFVVCGAFDPGNPDAISESELSALTSDGTLEYWGMRNDMHNVYAESAVACLPSYYGEGLPLTLAEAAAAGRAIVTTDLPGCRDTVVDGVSGFLVPPRNAEALAQRLKPLLVDPQMAQRLGAASRRLAEERFSVESVVSGHFSVYERMVNSGESA